MFENPTNAHHRKSISSTLLKGLDAITLMSSGSDGLMLPEIVQALNEPRSNVLRLLKSLALYGLVEQDGRRWRVSNSLATWAMPDRHTWYKSRYRPVLETLSRSTGELVLVGLHEGNGIIHLDYIEADHPLYVARTPQTRHNLRINAMGKLALSRRPDLWIDLPSALAEEITLIRETGIAWNREESAPGMIAMAHCGFTNTPTDAMIAVAWPVQRFSEEKAQVAVEEIRKALSAHRPPST